MRSCEILKAIAQVDDCAACRSLRSLAMSASLGLWWVQVAASFHESCRLRRNCRVHSFLGLEFDVELAQHTAVDVLPSGDAETE